MIDRDWLERRYTTDRAPIEVIAAEAGSHPASVYRALRRHAIPRRGRLRARWADVLTERELAARLGAGQSAGDVARDVGCSVQTVLTHAVGHGLDHLLTHRSTPPPQADLDRARELNAAGHTRAEIAEQLGVSVRTVTRRLAATGVTGRPGRPRR